MLWEHVPRGPRPPALVHVIVETPRGSRAKYGSVEGHDAMVLTKRLPATLAFPTNTGFFARCWGEDDDPLDAFVLGGPRIPPGVVVEARPIGVLRMRDRGDRDDKVVCTLNQDRSWDRARTLADIPKDLRESIERFYEIYREHEGTQGSVELEGWAGRREAHALIKEGYRRSDERTE